MVSSFRPLLDRLEQFRTWCERLKSRGTRRCSSPGTRGQCFIPCLEEFEKRITPANLTWVFDGAAGTTDYATTGNWEIPFGATTPLPDNQDMVVIAAPCVISGATTANVAEVSIMGSNSLTVDGTLDVAPNGNTAGFTGDISSVSGSSLTDNGTINVSGNTGLLAGTTTIAGAFNLQSGGTSGSDETTTGPTTLAANGHIDSYGLSVFHVANSSSAPFTVSGGAFDLSSNGLIDISGVVDLLTNVSMSGQLDITPSTYLPGPGVTTPGADLTGAGGFTDWGIADWSGGTLANAGGFDIAGSALFSADGSATKFLQTTLTNDNISTTLGGTGTITVGAPGAVGVLDNDQPGSILTLDTSLVVYNGNASAVLNDGYLDVGGGGTVTITGLTSDASTSQVNVASGTTLDLSGNDTLGGTLNNAGATVVVPSGVTGDAIAAPLTQNLFGQTQGNFLVQGTLTIAPGASATFNGPVEIASGGTLTANGPITTTAALTLDPGPSHLTAWAALETDGTTTIKSGATLSDTALVTNAGDFSVNAGASLTASGGLSNSGNLNVAGMATVSGALTNTHNVEVLAGGTLSETGTLTNDTTLTVDGGGTLTDMGTLDNEGTLVLVPGDSAFASGLQEDGTLLAQVASATSYGVLHVWGLANLTNNSTLTVSLLNGYVPPAGTNFVVLGYGSRQGTFGAVHLPNDHWTISYGSSGVTLTAG